MSAVGTGGPNGDVGLDGKRRCAVGDGTCNGTEGAVRAAVGDDSHGNGCCRLSPDLDGQMDDGLR